MLIDTLEGHEAAQEALADIKKVIKDKPIVAIILTHFHADHTGKYFDFSFKHTVDLRFSDTKFSDNP